MFDFLLWAQQCAPDIHQDTLRRIVRVESGFNPYAIGVVGGHLERQPRNRDEAVSTAQWLESHGFNYSAGLAQVNKANFARYGLTLETVFDICPNLQAGGAILKDCFVRTLKTQNDEQRALRDAFSCYYSGNFTTGYQQGYVLRIVSSDRANRKRGLAIPTKGSYKERDSVSTHSVRSTAENNDATADVSAPTHSALLF